MNRKSIALAALVFFSAPGWSAFQCSLAVKAFQEREYNTGINVKCSIDGFLPGEHISARKNLVHLVASPPKSRDELITVKAGRKIMLCQALDRTEYHFPRE